MEAPTEARLSSKRHPGALGMRSRLRIRRALRWFRALALVAAAASLLLFLGSIRWWVLIVHSRSGGTHTIMLTRGAVTVTKSAGSFGALAVRATWHFDHGTLPLTSGNPVIWRPSRQGAAPPWGGRETVVPLWAPTVLFAALAALPLRRLVPLRAVNACDRCGYDRSGLPGPTTPCPECGAAAA